MKNFIKRHHRESKGFTLVELLIVFSLLAVLAAIMIPNVSGFVDYGHTQAAAAELSIVQTAMDSMMAKRNLNAVTAASGVQDMSAYPAEQALYPDYLRYQTTKGTYNWDITGLVSQNSTGY